jgi:teichoic acid transport system permease protein
MQEPDRIDQPPLRRLDATPGFFPYLRDLWQFRDFAVATARYDHRASNNGFLFGHLWFVLTPVLRISVYGLIFSVLLAGRRPPDFLAVLAVGIFVFVFMQGIVTEGAASLDRNGALLRSLPFPRAILPVSVTLRQFLRFRYEAAVMLAVVLLTTGSLGGGWLAFVVIVIPMATMTALGLALTLAPVVLRLRDTLRLLPFVFRFTFYLSGVLFPIGLLIDEYAILRFLLLNPFYVVVSLARHLVLAPDPQATDLWAAAFLWTVGAMTFGLWVFRRDEHRYARG